MATVKGVDLSYANAKVDYKALKDAGYKFVIIRAGYGRLISQKDAKFEEHYKGAKAAGLGVGAYWYSYAKTADQAIAEAQTCIEVIKGKQFEYPIYFDLEEKSQFSTGRNNVSSMISAFCGAMEAAGYFAGLYMSTSYLTEYVKDDVKKRYTLWVAQYYSSCTYKGAGVVDMWQKSSTGKISGNSGNFDLDDCYRDFPKEIKALGLNGFKKTTTEAKDKYRVQIDFKTKTDATKCSDMLKKSGYTPKITEIK